MHEALRHHTLLQLKTVNTPPSSGLAISENSSNDSHAKFRGTNGTTLRNILSGKSNDGNVHSMTGRTVQLVAGGDQCSVEQQAMAATKCPTYLDMFTSPVSTMQSLMAELLGAADEFKRLHISSSECDSNHSATVDDIDVTTVVPSTFSVSRISQITLRLFVLLCVHIYIYIVFMFYSQMQK